MKLHNKKTGEIREFGYLQNDYGKNLVLTVDSGKETVEMFTYNSLAELNKEWEDYEPKEPLIKDEKIRKAVKAWAEANYIEDNDRVLARRWDAYDFVEIEKEYKMSIRFYLTTIDRILELENRTYYTIAELCGEEE